VSDCFNVLHAGVDSIIGAEFAAAAVLISFGAVLGKVSPIQLLIMAVVEVVLFQVNQLIVFKTLQVQLTLCMIPVMVLLLFWLTSMLYAANTSTLIVSLNPLAGSV